MYRKKIISYKTEIYCNEMIEGEMIETKIERITSNREPIDATAEIIYTEMKDGVLAGYNVRTDRFEIALEAMDKVNRSAIARRDNPVKKEEKIVKNESTQGDSSGGEPAA